MARRRGGGELVEEPLRFEDGDREAQNDDEGRANGQKRAHAEHRPAVVRNDIRRQEEPTARAVVVSIDLNTFTLATRRLAPTGRTLLTLSGIVVRCD